MFLNIMNYAISPHAIMKVMDISIIVPVYNAEKYLDNCLQSILRALDNFDGRGEILLINNNSTDKSDTLMRKYQKKYPETVFLYKQKVPGAAATRNYGVLKATGRYIWFVDADDAISSGAVEKLVDRAKETSVDLVMMGAKRIFPDGHTNFLPAICPNVDDYKSKFVRYGAGPWQFIIRRAWWNKNNFKFREGIIHEDMELMSALILYTDKFACVDEPLYNYFQNPESVLHKTSWDPHYFDIFPALSGLYARFNEKGAVQNYYSELEWFFIWNLLIDSAKDFGKFKEGRSGFERSREMLKQYFSNWRKNKFLREKPWKLRARVILNYYK